MLFYNPEKRIDAEYFRNSKKFQSSLSVPVNLKTPQKSMTIVTTCMNRLHDLKLTLPKNLKDNEDYGPLEFLLLDYGSTDGLEHWVKEVLGNYIKQGRLTFYHTEQEFFQPNHSRNVTFRLARGDLVANVDSDNFTHSGYACRLNQCASVANERLLIVPDNFLLPNTKRLKLKGRFCLYKKDIELLRGFDEELDIGFGNDDMNFVLRAMLAGFKMVRYESAFTEDRLDTTNSERVAMVRNKNFMAIMEDNGEKTWAKLAKGVIAVNQDKQWGAAKLIKNFSEAIEI